MQDLIKEYYSNIIDKSVISRISLYFNCKKYKKGNVILLQESLSESDGLYFVKKGLLESRFTLSTGREIKINDYKSGSFAGFITLFDKLPHPYSVIAKEDSELFFLSIGDASSIFKRNDRDTFFFKKLLLISIARELRIITNHLSQFFKIDKVEESNIVNKRLNTFPAKEHDIDSYNKKFYSLKCLDIFSGLDDSEIDLLTTLSKSYLYEKDQLIFSEGSDGESIYFIIEGEVRISKFFPEVGEEALVILKQGDFFGEMAFLDPSPRSAYAVSNSTTLVYTVTNQTLEALFKLNIADAIKILNIFGYIMSTRCRRTMNTVEFWKIIEGGF